MGSKIINVIFSVIGIIFGFVVAKYLNVEMFEFSRANAIIFGVLAIGATIIISLIYLGAKSPRDAPHALGLPQGSVRAIIASSLIVFFMLASLLFYLESEKKVELAEQILTILGTLVIAVSAFYFGVKATEQGSRIALQTFRRTETGSDHNVPPKIILEAISKYKETWINTYGCKDIKLGKKQSEDIPFDLNCILFLVESKKRPENAAEIPVTVLHSAAGVEYNIPTDVKLAGAPVEDDRATENVLTLDIVEELIIEKKIEWMEKYSVEAIIASLKVKECDTLNIPCVQFIVKDKHKLPENAETIPEYFEYKNFQIPTDVKEEDEPTADIAEVCPGEGVSRQSSDAIGTLGIKVFREENGRTQDYWLSCYHVFCNPELKEGKTTFENTSDSDVILNSTESDFKIGSVVDGSFDADRGLDAAIAKIGEGIEAIAKLKGFSQTPKHGIRLISNKDVQNRMRVFTYGAVSKSNVGSVIARKIDREITFFGKAYYFQDVIPVTKISVPGDSGAMVADSRGKIIGIVFASNSSTSYVIPIATIISKFKIRIHYV